MENKSNPLFFWKAIITLILIIIGAVAGETAYKAIGSGWLENASFVTICIAFIVFILLIYAVIRGIKYTWKSLFFVVSIAFILQACSYAKSNQQVVISDDCGVTWEKISAGESVPKGVGNPCFMKVVMPNYPMQGDSRFICNLKEKVRAATHIDYDYSITEPLAFIKQAKYLGKANTDVDSSGALEASAFEGAENMVIDKRIRDVAKGLFIKEDIVELDQAELENTLLSESNKVLEPLGVHLNFITLTFDLDEQTRQAIDVSTAMKIYVSKDLVEVGREVMIQRSGAPKIIIESQPQQKPTEE